MVDKFKTQIMFLHPEPSLMEPCARRLGEDYSIHMAASGTEALTTLGITPIDIIISAQDLPGMSGQEALKEAKKRSPETRGILLASARMSEADRAALVNVRHLNRILKAESTVDEICNAIQHELHPELAESLQKPANDHSAGPRHGSSSPRVDSASRTGAYNILQDDIPVLEPGAAETAQQAAQNISQVEIVVLTNDASFLKTIRAATGSSHVVNHAPNLQEAVDVVREGSSGVLITDAAVAVRDVETITAKLRKHMPSLVTIVAGRREDGEKMMGLISDGLVYRFLLKPISPGRSRLAIEASAKKHLTLANTEVPLSPSDVQQKMTETGIIKGVTFDSGLFRTTDVRQSNVNLPTLDDDDVDDSGFMERVIGRFGVVGPAIAVGVVVIALAALMLTGGDGESPAVPVGEAQPAAAAAPAAATAPRQATVEERVNDALTRAERALTDGRLLSPADDNAVVHYAQAAALRRDDAQLRASLDNVLQRAFTQLEGDLLRDNLRGAQSALAVLNDTVPGHPRLAFFNRQVNKEVARRDLASIEQSIDAGDIDAARATLTRIENSGIVDSAITDTLRSRLQTARAAEPVAIADLLERAAQRVSENRLIAPANDSARFYYQAALDSEPGNAVARQGMTFVASILLSDARTALARGDWQSAQTLLDEAQASGASSVEVSALRDELRQVQNADGDIASAGNETGLAEDRGAASTQSNSNAAAATQSPAQSPGTTASQTNALPAETQLETGAPPTVPASIGADSPAVSAPATAAAQADEQDFDLQQISYEPPRYPRTAQRRGIEGWVDVQFIVRQDGSTDQISIAESVPGEVFDSAAINAVSEWRYAPLPTENPNAFSRARIRLEFNLSE